MGKSEALTFIRLRDASIELYRRCISAPEMGINTLGDAASMLPEIRAQATTPQVNTDTSREGEHTYMETETVCPFPPKIDDGNDILLFLPLVEPLTKREIEILHCLVAGLSNKEIAQQLVLSVGTIKWHLKNVYNKLNVHTRSQAIARAGALQL